MSLAACSVAFAEDDAPQVKGIRVAAPSPGRYVVSGFAAFPPGATPSAGNIRIVTTGSTCDEVPSVVRAEALWFDDSLKLAEVVFLLEADQQGAQYFWLEWGPGVRRADLETPDVGGSLETLYFEEAEVPSPGFDVEAGRLLVRVVPHPDLWYYSLLFPAGVIIVVLVWRKVKLSR